jgi:hypothetical protein
LQPRAQAYREAGWNDRSDAGAYIATPADLNIALGLGIALRF